MRSAKIGSSPAPAPKPSRSPAESKPAATRPTEPDSGAARIPGSRDEFTPAAAGSKSQAPSTAPAQGATRTLPKELEPFRAQLDDLAKRLSSDPELVNDDGKLMRAIIEGVKTIPDIPRELIRPAAGYVFSQVRGAHSGGEEHFG